MTRIRFEDLPSTNTPRNAENLNKLNNVVISPTEPTTGEEVWIKKGKNLFNPKNAFVTGDVSQDIAIRYENIKIGGTYTFSTPYAWTTIHAYNSSGELVRTLGATSSSYVQSITIQEGETYLILLFSSGSTGLTDTTGINFTGVQFEQGSTATTYEEYIDKKIYTKNDNGVYEEFYDEEVLNKKYELKSYTNWQKTYVVNCDLYTPVIVVVCWQQSIAAYAILLGRVVELGKSGTNSISYTISEDETQVTFTLGDTGIFRTISLTQ